MTKRIMMTEDKHDSLEELFRNFDPELHSDHSFMHDLQQRIEGVELVRKESARSLKNTRLAVVAGVIAGFIAGVLATLAYPSLTAFISGISFDGIALSGSWTSATAQIIVAAVSLVAALGVYNFTLRLAPAED